MGGMAMWLWLFLFLKVSKKFDILPKVVKNSVWNKNQF